MAAEKGQANAPAVSDENRPFAKMREELKGMASLDAAAGGGVEIAMTVVDLIATADSIEDIFAANETGPTALDDYINVPISCTDVMYLKSADKYKGGLGTYAVFDILTDAGEPAKLSTGAPNVVASLRQMQRLGFCKPDKPARFRILSRETANGNLLLVGKP